MDTRFLESFVAVVDAGSVAEAARRLNLPPSTITQQLSALEKGVGAVLVTRAGRTVMPTVAGARIVESARDLLRGVRDLRSAASDTGLPAGPLRLGVTPTALMGLLPLPMRRWLRAHTDIQIYIEPGTSSVLLERVLSGGLDAAILVHPAFPLPKTCSWRLIQEEPLILLVPKRLRVDDPLLVAAREPFIQYDRKVVAGKQAYDYLRSHGIRPKVTFELDGIEHIAGLVAEGFGVSVLPDWPVRARQDEQVKRCPLPKPFPSRQVGMVWLRSSVRSPLAHEFYSHVKQ